MNRFFIRMAALMLGSFAMTAIAPCAWASNDSQTGGGGCLINCNGGGDPEWPDTDWWGLVKTLPDITPSKNAYFLTASCDNCTPEKLGPALQASAPHRLLAEAKDNWLLALALKKVEHLAAAGLSEVGAIWFTMPENQKQKQALLDGIELAAPTNPKSGFSGLTTYQRIGTKAADLDDRYIEIELKAWRVSNQKGAPTHGVSALLRYEKNRDGAWTLASVKANPTMPQPDLAYFPNLEKNSHLFSHFQFAN